MVEGKRIAWDIDDVLADNAGGFAEFCNTTWGLSMKPEDFSEDWCAMWGVDLEEVNRRSRIFHGSDVPLHYAPLVGAHDVVAALAEHNTNLVVTSRREALRAHTATWLDQHFSGLFASVHHSGIFDQETDTDHLLTKADVLVQISADFIVDDQPKHCFAAAERGIQAILYGNYNWNQVKLLPKGVVRCETPEALKEYFNVTR